MATLFDPNLKILIVDDFPVMRRALLTLFKQNGFTRFVEAEDGEQAFQMLLQNTDVRLVVSDWDMPKCSGLDLLKLMRADPRFESIPFIMVSALAEKEYITKAMQAGVDSYIVKPLNGSTLREKLKKLDQKINRAS